MSRLRLACQIAAVGFVLLGAVPAEVLAAKRYHAERFDVELRVEPDGSLHIVEMVAFRFDGGPFSFVWREIPTQRTDGLEILRATIDGRELPAGTASGSAEIERRRNRVKVTWHFISVSDASRIFGLEYVLRGAIEPVSDREASLRWHALPRQHEYTISASTIRIHLPSRIGLVGQPELRSRGRLTREAPEFETPTTLEPEPSRGGLLVLRASHVRRNASLFVNLRLDSRTTRFAAPAWLVRERRLRDEAPFWIGIGVLVGLAASAVLLTLWQQRRGHLTAPEYPEPAPPESLPPAVAGALVSDGASPNRIHPLATLFDLAQRGAVTIEELPRRWGLQPRRFAVRRTGGALETQPYERIVLESVPASSDEPMAMSKLVSRLGRRFRDFKAAVERELHEAGWIDQMQRRQKQKLTVVAWLLLALALVTLVFALPFLEMKGPALLAVPCGLIAAAVAGLVLAQKYSPLSEAGRQHAARWRGFRRYLQDVTRGRAPAVGRDVFERYLPYVTAFGLAAAWTRHFRQREPDLQIPAWFRALPTEDGSAAFYAMAGSSGTAGGAGGAAGAGGAGGVGSGAG